MVERGTMFRVSVILSVLLIGVTAKPWNKHENEDVKKAVVSIDEKRRLSWEVEPHQDMRDIQNEVDPRMTIWNKGPNNDPAAGDQPEPLKRYVSIEYSQRAEEDRDDDINPVNAEVIAEEPQDSDKEDNEAKEKVARYLAQLLSEYNVEVGGVPHQPEKKEDPISPVETEEVISKREGSIYLHPEKDLDDLYHKEIQVPVFYQDDTKAAAPAPPQREYSEPEVDLDHFYHK